MSKISFDDGLQLGYIVEGDLRRTEDGWIIQTADGDTQKLDDVLDDYTNKEIRLTVVDLKEADYAQKSLLQGAYDVSGENL
jgi:hypothetical protein